MKSILFVCTGNTCRSPMAEIIAKSVANQKNTDFNIESRGILAYQGYSASEKAIEAIKDKGLNLESHISSKVTDKDLKFFDYIFTMTQEHKKTLDPNGNYNDKIFTISEFATDTYTEILDPFGGNIIDYKNCADELSQYIEKIFERIIK